MDSSSKTWLWFLQPCFHSLKDCLYMVGKITVLIMNVLIIHNLVREGTVSASKHPFHPPRSSPVGKQTSLVQLLWEKQPPTSCWLHPYPTKWGWVGPIGKVPKRTHRSHSCLLQRPPCRDPHLPAGETTQKARGSFLDVEEGVHQSADSPKTKERKTPSGIRFARGIQKQRWFFCLPLALHEAELLITPHESVEEAEKWWQVFNCLETSSLPIPSHRHSALCSLCAWSLGLSLSLAVSLSVPLCPHFLSPPPLSL